MPDTFGKRERRKVQERKAMLREERREARRKRRQAGPVQQPELQPLSAPARHDEEDYPAPD
jgi:hypothetical protein